VRASRAVGIWLIAALICSACAGAAERTLITQFFAASRLRDLTALSNYATIVFEPLTDGIVTRFEITGIRETRSTDGNPIAKQVSVIAAVKAPSGQTVVKSFVITLGRGEPGDSDRDRSGRWLITAITAEPAGPAAPSTPRS
jgi:hypothetical protein